MNELKGNDFRRGICQKFLAPANLNVGFLEKKSTPKFLWRQFFIQESCVLEELGFFERHRQIPRQKSLPVVRLFFLYDPWRRGKSGIDRFAAD